MPEQKELLTKGIALLEKAVGVLSRIEARLPVPLRDDMPAGGDPPEPPVYRWARGKAGGRLRPVPFRPGVKLEDLLGIDRQKEILVRNTEQFIHGVEANNVLLWGARGTGKSSLIRALVARYAEAGLSLIEVGGEALRDLPEIVEQTRHWPHRFILFCDDLAFEARDSGFSELKALLDGAFSTASDQFVIYATSNRRHLLPETVETVLGDGAGELHPEEGVDERISLSERFGLWLPFYPFSQETYLEIVFHWLEVFGAGDVNREATRAEALRWALHRGSRSGRTAWQFARDAAGRLKLT